jgi:nucleoside-diphosphate-sugar epimerase
LLQAADLPMTDSAPSSRSGASQRDLGRVLVTGARGFIGAALVGALARQGETVTASDRGGDATDAAGFRACDITDAQQVDRLFDRDRFDTIVHCGAVSGPMVMADRPLEIWRINVLGTAHLLEAVRRQGMGRFVLCSSCSVYGVMNGAMIDEDTPPDPQSFYGASKLAAEQAMVGYGREHGIAAVALRLAWVYGPGRRTPTTLEELVRATLDGRNVEIAVSPTEITHYVHIDDVVAGLIAASRSSAPPRPVYNISAGRGLPMEQLVAILRRLAPEIRMTFTGPNSTDIGPAGFALGNADRDLGYRPQMSLGEGLKRYREALR